MSGEVDIIVATSAFGMGVDKSDVGLVVHYDISDSLENYVQKSRQPCSPAGKPWPMMSSWLSMLTGIRR